MIERWHALGLLLAASGCGSAVERPQLLLIVDTDAPVAAQLAERPEVAPQAAIDTLRVDVLDEHGESIETRQLSMPDPRDWPLSFGIASEPGQVFEVRLRAFRESWAEVDPDTRWSEPFLETTIDRLVRLEGPEEGIRGIHVLLSFDCLGVPARFVGEHATCIDAERLRAPAHRGFEEVADLELDSRVGTSPTPLEMPCRGSAVPGTRCIPGGFSVLGDAMFRALFGVLEAAPFPLRPVRVSPLWLDETEVTVGQVRQLLASGAISAAELPRPAAPGDHDLRWCTWLGPLEAQNDALPANCLEAAQAEAICRARGGRLPTEAEWAHAARGRGQGRRYPWGDSPPACCTASAGRHDGPCGSELGLEPVGSHRDSETCGPGDVSRDGLLDMGGSVLEWLESRIAAYTDACWSYTGIAVDPRCPPEPETKGRMVRAGHWRANPGAAIAAARRNAVAGSWVGFRCAFEDAP